LSFHYELEVVKISKKCEFMNLKIIVSVYDYIIFVT